MGSPLQSHPSAQTGLRPAEGDFLQMGIGAETWKGGTSDLVIWWWIGFGNLVMDGLELGGDRYDLLIEGPGRGCGRGE